MRMVKCFKRVLKLRKTEREDAESEEEEKKEFDSD